MPPPTLNSEEPVYVARVRGVKTTSTLWKANLSPVIPRDHRTRCAPCQDS